MGVEEGWRQGELSVCHLVRYWLFTLLEPKLQSTGSIRNAEATCWGWDPAATAARPPPIECPTVEENLHC